VLLQEAPQLGYLRAKAIDVLAAHPAKDSKQVLSPTDADANQGLLSLLTQESYYCLFGKALGGGFSPVARLGNLDNLVEHRFASHGRIKLVRRQARQDTGGAAAANRREPQAFDRRTGGLESIEECLAFVLQIGDDGHVGLDANSNLLVCQ
jgi:hypothetical protein